MMLLIGGLVCCGECEGVFATVQAYEQHVEMVHEAGPDLDNWKGSDACYAEGFRRVCRDC